MAAHLANDRTEEEALGGSLVFHRPHDAFLANDVRGSVFFLTGLPPDLALLVAAWVDLVTRFLPTTEDEAFFLTCLPPDLALLVAASIDLVFLIFFSPTIGHLRKRLAFERCVCTAFCTEVARYLQDCLVSLYVHRIAARPLAPADERATGIVSIGIVTKLPGTSRRAAMLHLENQEQSLTLRLNEMKWHRSHILHCATHSLSAIHLCSLGESCLSCAARGVKAATATPRVPLAPDWQSFWFAFV